MEIRRVTMSSPMNWFKLAWQAFTFQPSTWVVITAIQLVLSIAMDFYPLLQFLYLILVPFFTAGMYYCASLAEKKQQFNTDNFFSVFKRKDKYRVLIELAVLQVALSFIIGLVTSGFMPDITNQEAINPADMIVWMSLLVVLGGIFALLFFFIVPLIFFHDDIDVFSAMKLSFKACWRNIWPLTLYGVLAMIVIILGAIPIGLGLLVAMPVLVNAQYYSYLEIFAVETPEPDAERLDDDSENEGSDSGSGSTFEA